MNLFITTFEAVIVLLGIGLIGFWIIHRKVLPQQALGVLSPLALEIALPSLVFVNIYEDFTPTTLSDWWQLPLWWFFFMIIAAVLTFFLRYVSQKETRQEFAISLFYQNAIFFPLAIIAAMYPERPQYLVYLFLFTMFYPAFFFNTYFLFFRKKLREINWRRLFNLVLIATIVALVIVFVGMQEFIPDFAISILALLGGMTIPLIMLLIGGNIYLDFQKKGTIYTGELVKFVIIKNVVFPLIFLAILVVLRPVFHIALILMLQAAVPPVTAVPLFTQRAGGNHAIVNQFIVASFGSSLITIPVMMMLFGQFFSL